VLIVTSLNHKEAPKTIGNRIFIQCVLCNLNRSAQSKNDKGRPTINKQGKEALPQLQTSPLFANRRGSVFKWVRV